MKRLLLALVLTSACGIHIPGTPSTPPSPPTTWRVDVIACGNAFSNPCSQPLVGASISLHYTEGYKTQIANQDGYTVWTVPSSLVDSDATISAQGYVTQNFHVDVKGTHDGLKHNIFALTPLWPQPEKRSPLTLEPNDPTLLCHHVLPQSLSIPDLPDKRFWRGDAWGVTIPGLPVVPGGSSKHPERVLSWFLDRYSQDAQTKILQQYRRDGYTHFVLSWPDSRSGAGQSIDQYVATSVRVKQAIPYVAHFLTSKVYDPKDADATTRMAAVTPVVDALVRAKAVDILVVGWELDTFNEPHRLQDFIDALSARYPGIDLYVHFTTYKTAWQFNGEGRAAFWARNRGKLTGLLYQANQNDTCGLAQAHFNDALDGARSGLSGFVVVPWEVLASNQFDGPADEQSGNVRGWELMVTPGSILSSGFGNGGRYPDGRPTLPRYPVQ